MHYLWGSNDRLLSIVTDGNVKRFDYDGWGNLSKTFFENGQVEYRHPDKAGNLFERLDRLDRKYGAGGQLLKTENWEYKYDREGNLIRKKDKHGATWRYEWNEAGLLVRVKRPDSFEVSFTYDALGRRLEKEFLDTVTRWVWDGNVPLHEQRSDYRRDWDEVKKCIYWEETKQPLVTWVFEEGTFIPTAKLTETQKLSIAANYLGTPEAMYRDDGEAVWQCELNSYGKVRNFRGAAKTDCPFRYQGQYEDLETGLYYNRFRYYSPDEGLYLSQDPIGLQGNNPTLYGYVKDVNSWIDEFGLACKKPKVKKPFYRYIGEEEFHIIKRTGKIPNIDKSGNYKKIYYTNHNYKTAGRAKTHNQLRSKPKYRVEIDPSNVPDHKSFSWINPSDNPQWGIGGGVESTTSNSIIVDISNITLLKGG